MNQPTENVQLTFEQLQQIDVTQKRLGNLQNEIALAVKTLTETRNDCTRITKEKLYQEEMLEQVSTSLKTAQKEVYALDETRNQTSAELSTLKSEINEKSAKQTAKEMALKDREDKVVARETQIADKENKLSANNQIFKEQINTHNEKVAKLKAVIATF